jgi:hypothetical protein
MKMKVGLKNKKVLVVAFYLVYFIYFILYALPTLILPLPNKDEVQSLGLVLGDLAIDKV